MLRQIGEHGLDGLGEVACHVNGVGPHGGRAYSRSGPTAPWARSCERLRGLAGETAHPAAVRLPSTQDSPTRCTLSPMPTSLVTGGAGFLGSHLCDYLLARGHRVICVDNLETGSLKQHRAHPTTTRLRLPDARHHRPLRGRRAGRLRLPHGFARQPDRLRAAAAAHAEGGRLRHAQRARPRQGQARALPAGLHLRGLRRPAGAPAARDLLGQREPDRPPRRVRRGQALRRGADDGLPAPAGRGHLHRADLQHLRPSDAGQRRPRDPRVPEPGAHRPAAHRLRRRLADAQLLLRRRPDPRASCRSPSPTCTSR